MRENRPLTSVRGIAAVYVVCYHMNAWIRPDLVPRSVFGYGYSAVDVFFVLSGFILATVYGRIALDDFSQFMVKRVLRLYPLHLAIMLFLAVAIAGAPLIHINMHSDQFHAWHAFPYVLLLIQPFTSAQGGWNNPSWSIGIELLCYVLFPFVIVALRRVPLAYVFCVAVCLATLQALLLRTAFDATSGSDAIFRGLLGFFFGVTFRLSINTFQGLSSRRASVLSLAAIAGIVAAATFGAHNLIPLAATVLVGVLLFERGVVARALSTRIPLWLGHISFSVYLLHDPVIVVMGKLMPLRRVPLPMPFAGWVYATVILAIIMTVGTFTYRWIEQPGRHLWRSRYAPLNLPVEAAAPMPALA